MSRHAKTTRRTFLKGLTATGFAAAAFPQIISPRALGAAGESLNIALLGSGGRSGQLLPSILRGGGNIVAMCDVDASRFQRIKNVAAKEQRGESVEKAKVYDDYRKLLDAEKSVDAVVIAAGQRWHAYMCKAAMAAGKHVFCEKPLAHSVAEARMLRDLGRQTRLATQIGSQGGASDAFRRSMEIIQAGLLGQIHEAHAWINRTFPPSAAIDQNADPIPDGLNWDFWCGPSALLPFKGYYLRGCLAWGRWLEFGDGHLADMGAHGLNLPWRALKLGPVVKASVKIPDSEPLKDSYPSATTFRWDFAARDNFDPVSVYWHDGPKAGPPEELSKELLATYQRVPGDGVLFAGEKGMLLSNAWGQNGVMKMKGETRFRGVLDHEAAKPLKVEYPRARGQNHMEEWMRAATGDGQTFQPFATAAMIGEMSMIGMVALRLGKPIDWDPEAAKAKGMPEADALIQRPPRQKWL